MADDNKPTDYLAALASSKRNSVQLRVFNGGKGGAGDGGPGGGGFALVAEGSVFDIPDFVWAVSEDVVLERVEAIVEVEDTEFVACRDEGGEAAGLPGAGVAHAAELGVAIGLVVS